MDAKEFSPWLDEFQASAVEEIQTKFSLLFDQSQGVKATAWQLLKKDELWDQSIKELALVEIEVTGDYSGTAYVAVPIRNAIYMGGKLAMYQEQRMIEMMDAMEIDGNCLDAFGEICNQLIGCFNHTVGGFLEKNVHYKQGKTVWGHEDGTSKAFEIDEEFCVKFLYSLKSEDSEANHFQVIFPAPIINQFLGKDVAWDDVEIGKDGRPLGEGEDDEFGDDEGIDGRLRGLVLLVDVHPFMRYTLKQVLVNAGFQVEEADNKHSAFSRAKRIEPDFIIMDIFAPNLDGIDVVIQIRTTKRISKIPIIMRSSKDDPSYAAKSRLAGANEFVTKSINYQDLIKKIERHLAFERKVRAMMSEE